MTTLPGLTLSLLRERTWSAPNQPLTVSGRFTVLGLGIPGLIQVSLEGPSHNPEVLTFTTTSSPFTGDYSVNVIAPTDGDYEVHAEAFPPAPGPLRGPALARSPRPPVVIGDLQGEGVVQDLPDGSRRSPLPQPTRLEVASPVSVSAPVSITLGGGPGGGGGIGALPFRPLPGPTPVFPGVPSEPPPAPETPSIGATIVGVTIE